LTWLFLNNSVAHTSFFGTAVQAYSIAEHQLNIKEITHALRDVVVMCEEEEEEQKYLQSLDYITAMRMGEQMSTTSMY